MIRPEDSEIEVANMNEGIGKVISFPSIWGHWAGGRFCEYMYILIPPPFPPAPKNSLIYFTGPGDSTEDVTWLDEKLREVGL